MFAIFEDPCLLGNSERLQSLKYIHKTFSLELLESILTKFSKARVSSISFCTSSSYISYYFNNTTSPLFLKTLSEFSAFPCTLRRTRTVFLTILR